MDLEPVIGLEIHVQLTTKSKMFCSCSNVFPASGGTPRHGGVVADIRPNTAICPICLGYPGTLPVPNGQAIEWTQLVGASLGCQLAQRSKFDRKSYFYPDLPKGYQISQYDQPFCGQGQLAMMTDEGEQVVGITRIHLEEDAAKNTHPSTGLPAGQTGSGQAPYTLVDYNRAGTPLMEIVTEPDIRTPQQAKLFLQELQRIVRSLGVSDADMEKGQMRCDANISLRERGSEDLHPKTEIKNVNSWRFVKKALQFEIERQTKLWEQGSIPAQATRGWDSEQARTVEQRTKEEAADYRYFPEPDIPPFMFTEEYLNTISKRITELPHEARARLQKQYGISLEHAQMFVGSKDLLSFFEDVASELEQLDKERVDVSSRSIPGLVKLAATWILRDIRQLMTDQKLTRKSLRISAENFAEVIVLLHQGKMNSYAVKPVLTEMQATGGDPDPILKKLGLEQVSGEDQLEKFVQEVIDENLEAVEKIKAGKEAALQFLMGQVMAKLKGSANPQVVIKLLRQKIGLTE